jgi:steroid delta-isomerase
LTGTGRAHAHIDWFNAAVRTNAWTPFADRFAEDARMVFTNVPAGPYEGRAGILAGYEAQPPDDTMSIESVETVDADTDKVRFRWDHGGPGTMLLRWRGAEVTLLEITFG